MILINFTPTFSQKNSTNKKLRVVFYNLENYFDSFSDSLIDYNDFSPEGNYHWNYKKYEQKTKSIYKVLQNVKGWECATLIGVCEIENKNVIQHLLYKTPLKNSGFNYIHYDSPDQRGIDVALFYTKGFEPLESMPIFLYQNNKKLNSRNILYVKGVFGKDTLHVFVNHWTSRYRGVAESAPIRMGFSDLLKSKTDSLLLQNDNANIVIIGDFNDEPNDASLKNLVKNTTLKNLALNYKSINSMGSVKFKEDWFIFDQIIVSKSLYLNNNGLKSSKGMTIFDPIWILENDKKYLGMKPYRTNHGFRYNGGYSDHLPVYIEIVKTN
ncbi:MAG: endonuclease [Marinilabiliales bacterium]|nr:MAG: endonuclease [Marinilabiliales bacterium]